MQVLKRNLVYSTLQAKFLNKHQEKCNRKNMTARPNYQGTHKAISLFKYRETSGKSEKNISKENKNGLATYICISAVFMSFH